MRGSCTSLHWPSFVQNELPPLQSSLSPSRPLSRMSRWGQPCVVGQILAHASSLMSIPIRFNQQALSCSRDLLAPAPPAPPSAAPKAPHMHVHCNQSSHLDMTLALCQPQSCSMFCFRTEPLQVLVWLTAEPRVSGSPTNIWQLGISNCTSESRFLLPFW